MVRYHLLVLWYAAYFLALMIVVSQRKLSAADGVVRVRSWVTGTVSVHSHPADDSFAVLQRLELDLVGLETSTTFLSHGRSRCRGFARLTRRISPLSSPVTEQDIFLAKRVLLTESTVPASHGDECIVYPFSVFLPAALPPTMEYWNENDGSNCSFSYQLTATAYISLIRDADDADSTTRTARATRVLYVIGEAPPMVKYPFTTTPTSHPMKRGVFRRGRIIVAVHAENTHVSKGNYVCFALAITNKSQCDVDYVKVTFVEKIGHGRMGAKDDQINGLYIKNHMAVLRSNVIWLPEGTHDEQDTGVGAFQLKEVTPTTTESYNFDELTRMARNRTRVLVPPESRISSTGKYTNISHCIHIKVAVKDTPIHCYPTLTIPVTVFDQPLVTNRIKYNAVLGGWALSGT
jgi:hypothetical protein